MKDQNDQNIVLEGITASEGISIGRIVVYRTDFDDVTRYDISDDEIEEELERYHAAVEEINAVFKENKSRVESEIGEESARIYDAYLLILSDPFFQQEIPDAIEQEKTNAEAVILSHLRRYEKHFTDVKNEYLRERIGDIRGISRRIIYHLLQSESQSGTSGRTARIVVARELTPADSIHFHHKSLHGIITEYGGKTSHAAILARSIEVPALVGVKNLLKHAQNDQKAIIDGATGKIILNPDERWLKIYEDKKQDFLKRKKDLYGLIDRPLKKIGSRCIRLLANINEPGEVEAALRYKADGVGLYRTELQFVARERFLTEEEQFALYKDCVEKFNGSEVVIRILDLGGDKFLPFSDLQREANPFLGWRSVRILLSETEIFKHQLKAIFRAAAYGKAKILIPMISSKEEIIACKEIIRESLAELEADKIKHDPNVEIGVMIEIPSAAILISYLIEEIDFVSIGTNDLIQYTLAVDRNNEKVAHFYQPLNPAVLNLIYKVAKECRHHGKGLSVCGEMAGDPLYTQLLLALGVDDLSMQPSSIPEIKNIILNTEPRVLKEIEKRMLSYCSIDTLRDFLAREMEKANR